MRVARRCLSVLLAYYCSSVVTYVMHKALGVIDSEKNDLFKIMNNLTPFDALMASVRERAKENEKVLSFKTTVQNLLEQESFTSLRDVLLPSDEAAADTSDETMAKLITFLESSELLFKSVPPTTPENRDPDLMPAIVSTLDQIGSLCCPFFDKVEADFAVCTAALMDAMRDIEKSGLNRQKMEDNGRQFARLSVTRTALAKAMELFKSMCERSGTFSPQSLRPAALMLGKVSKCADMVDGASALCAVVNAEGKLSASANTVQLESSKLSFACRTLNAFSVAVADSNEASHVCSYNPGLLLCHR